MNDSSFDVLGATITEPFTLLTNLLVAGASFIFGHILFRSKKSDKQAKYWSMFFLFMGIASIFGGIAHGFSTYVGINAHHAARITASIAIFSAQIASLLLIKNKEVYNVIKWIIIIELVVVISTIIYFESFKPVLINTAFGLVGIVTPIQLIEYRSSKQQRHIIIVAGILSNTIPAIIHIFKISYNNWFSFNDIGHTLMIFCFYIMFVGVRKVPENNIYPVDT